MLEDLSAYSELLDPHVTSAPQAARFQAARDRDQVLGVGVQRGQEAGIRGSVYDVKVLGDRFLISMRRAEAHENARERGGAALRFQVLTVHRTAVLWTSLNSMTRRKRSLTVARRTADPVSRRSPYSTGNRKIPRARARATADERLCTPSLR